MKFVWIIFLALNLTGAALAGVKEELRAVKITNVDSDVLFSDEKIAEAMDYLASIGINTILCVVWNSNSADGDYTLYPSDVMERYFGTKIHPLFKGRDPLQRVIIEAHRNGMEVLPWFEMGFSTSYSQNGGHIIEKYPHWALKDKHGQLLVKNGFDWMSAANPEVQQFMLELTVEVADQYDIDGIEYSDRIPAMPVEGGYDSVTIALYMDEHDGNVPPTNERDEAWKRWRADKLSQFFQNVRDSIKARGDHLIVSSSPSLYPWSYNEYLQDSKTWVESGIVDNIIPQVYRYNYSEYQYELQKSLNNFPNHRDVYFSGMLIRLGDYIIDTDFFLDCLSLNRDRNVNGEAFFFYEGLRANNNILGDTLGATFYAKPALTPGRNGNIRRPKATIVNEDNADVTKSDGWQAYTNISGFRGGCLYTTAGAEPYIEYAMDVEFDAWYGLYAYGITHWNATDSAGYIINTGTNQDTIVIDQSDIANKGWHKLSDIYLTEGAGQKIVRLSNLDDNDKICFADAMMLMINRKRSPEVVVTNLTPKDTSNVSLPEPIQLYQNYPNPFNPETVIRYSLSVNCHVDLNIYNLLGEKVATLVSEKQNAGIYSVRWNASVFSAGVYFYRIITDKGFMQTKKLVLLK